MKIEKKLFYKNVTLLDYAFVNEKGSVIGNSLHVDVEFIGGEDKDGVIYDFSLAKNRVKSLIDKYIDHRIVVSSRLVKEVGTKSYELKIGDINYVAPKEAFCLIDSNNITYHDIELKAVSIIRKEVPDNIKEINIILREEVGEFTFFNYTHGLKSHYGNCQRLLHGHRNPLEIWMSGVRRRDLESRFIKTFLSNDVHFVFFENVLNREDILKECNDITPSGVVSSVSNVSLGYSSAQGEFSLTIPGRNCYFVSVESTVENMAATFLKHIISEYDIDGDISVVVYEGIGKGSRSSKCTETV